jgi:hypothetical protein
MPPPLRVDLATALAYRLERQFLAGQRASSASEVVERLVAVPSWSGDAQRAIGLRMQQPTDDALNTAVQRDEILRTYSFRGTVHLMTPATASIHLALRRAGRQWELPSWQTFYELSPLDWPPLIETVETALSGGPLTRDELIDEVCRTPRFAHLRGPLGNKSETLIKPLAWNGALRMGPSRDGERTFASFEGVDGWEPSPDLDEAGTAALLAYLDAYGPARRVRLDYWLGEGLSAGRKRIDRWIDALGDDLAQVEVDGTPALAASAQLDALVNAAPTNDTIYLPGLDQWALGPGTSDDWIVPPDVRPLVTQGAGMVIRGGTLVGTWKQRRGDIETTWLEA